LITLLFILSLVDIAYRHRAVCILVFFPILILSIFIRHTHSLPLVKKCFFFFTCIFSPRQNNTLYIIVVFTTKISLTIISDYL
jgi:hypothetical protein